MSGASASAGHSLHLRSASNQTKPAQEEESPIGRRSHSQSFTHVKSENTSPVTAGAGYPAGGPRSGQYKRARPSAGSSGSGSGGQSPRTPLTGGSKSSPSFPSDPLPPLTLGDHFTLQAKPGTLREFLGDSYWSSWMDRVCDGKLVGVAVRYTGENTVMMQFRDPERISQKGKRYPFSLSLPQEYLIPVPTDQLRRTGAGSGKNRGAYTKEGALPFEGIASVPEMSAGYHHDAPESSTSEVQKKMCVVCGAVGQKGETRPSGFKCNQCVGKSSDKKLRDEAHRQSNTVTPSAQ